MLTLAGICANILLLFLIIFEIWVVFHLPFRIGISISWTDRDGEARNLLIKWRVPSLGMDKEASPKLWIEWLIPSMADEESGQAPVSKKSPEPRQHHAARPRKGKRQ